MNREIYDYEEWFQIRFEKYFNKHIKQQGLLKTWVAKVYSVGTGVASVTLPNDDTNVIPDIPNPHGFTLNVGDVVELHSRLFTLGSAYIGVKY